jgi:excinuclease ABC subunit B
MVGRSDETQYITEEYLAELEAEMLAAAEELEFERAAALRDRIRALKQRDLAGFFSAVTESASVEPVAPAE